MENELTIVYSDPTLNVAWPKFQEYIVSTKNSSGLNLQDALNRLESKTWKF